MAGKHLLVVAGEFLPELRKKNSEAKWADCVTHIYDNYDVVGQVVHKGEQKFIVKERAK